MKLKYYLRGLGTGILLTTIILAVANTIHNGRQSLSVKEPASTSAVFDFTREETKADNQTPAVGEKDSQSMSDAATVLSKENQTMETDTDNQQNITVDLSNVTYTQRAAQMLAAAGVIENWEDFNSYLIQKEYSLKVRQGVYHFQKGQDYETIAKTLVGEK